MLREQQDQSVLFLGETGSGKTEAHKLFVSQLCALSRSAKKKSKVISGVLKTETLLEAFGTAATVDNPTSSRFGRYTEYQFDDRGKLVGAKLLTYLLEKSRVAATNHEDGANFNVFYWLLAGAAPEERQALRLSDASHFPYLSAPRGTSKSSSPSVVRNSSGDAAHFANLRDHMKSVGIGKRQQGAIFQTLAAILHLSTITFIDDPNKVNEACEVKNHDALAQAAALLGVDAVNLEYSLTYKTKLIRKELCTIYLNAADAAKQRDSLSTTLYSLIFEWIVEHLNARLDQEDCATFIGTVDLSGFQDYKVNKFEQLLYNFANEKLQAYYKNRVFEEANAEHYSEGINVPRIPDYPKSTDSLQLFIGNGDNSMIPLIEAESQRAITRGDAHLIQTFNERLSANPCFAANSKTKSTIFSVRHYAGLVEYDALGLAERNMDAAIPTDFISLFRGNSYDIRPSENSFIRSLFSGKGVQNDATGSQLHMSPLRKPSVRRKPNSLNGRTKETANIAATLENSLNELLETLSDTVSWQVFCIKPNEDLVDNEFDVRTVNGQLTHLCIPQLAQARSWDYTASMTFDDFKTKYRLIVEPLGLDMSHGAKSLVREYTSLTKKTQKDIAVGNTRVYMSESTFRSIEDELRVIEQAIQEEVKVQRRAPNSSGGPRSRYNDDESVQGSGYYDDGSAYGDELESHYESEFQFTPANASKGDIELGQVNNPNRLASSSAAPLLADSKEAEPKKKMSPSRCRWVCLTWCLTWWVPSPCLSLCGMKRPDIRMAWREKVALCIIIFLMCALMLFFIIGFGMLICPHQNVYSAFELGSLTSTSNPYVYAYGRVYKIPGVLNNHLTSYQVPNYQWEGILGGDVSSYFYKAQNFPVYCPGLNAPASNWDNISPRVSNLYAHNATSMDGTPRHYLEFMNQYAVARVAWPMSYISGTASETRKLLVIYNNVYDVSKYFDGGSNNFLNNNMQNVFGSFWGKDATAQFQQVIAAEGPEQAQRYLQCMNNLFYIGTIDRRDDLNCRVSNGILLTATIILCLVIGVKFVSALQFGAMKEPEEHDKFVICQIPCYTEDAESLSNTLESIALLRYDDKRKLIFVVADGMIIGSGNDRPTPRIVLDILGVDPLTDPDLLSFESLGEGDKQHNMGKVYSGLYELQGHNVPFIVVVKCGKPSERSRPGNRGKRDSQMILMRFLNRVHFNAEMNPLELELYHHMKNIIGVNPSFYEYILMVDADTEVFTDSLNRMVSAMIHDSRIMGICGETLIANEKESFFTMIQVYEYFISHHLSKAFESLFGSVTCLPGCFCMYRVRTPTKNIPLLIAPAVIDGYSENNVDTLHMKNLLHLGEDRYLTTLMMKHFPKYKLTFTPDAQCKTNVPDRWPVLLSQRRRWINSTIHNLVELLMLPQLCGFCCFSMRFVVFLDLFSTAIQPAAIVYIGYLIYSVVTSSSQFPLISVVMIAAIYGLQVIIFLIKREWAQIAWMILYILASPVFSFYIPLYAFWHFDDFSWGNTRVVVGDKGKKILAADVVPFDPASIPRRRWAEFEKDAFEKHSDPSEYDARSGAPSVYSDGGNNRHRSATGAQLGFIPPPASTYGTASVYGTASNMGGSAVAPPISPYAFAGGYAPMNGGQVMYPQQLPPGYNYGYAESVGSNRMSMIGTPDALQQQQQQQQQQSNRLSMFGGVPVAIAPSVSAPMTVGGEPTDEQLLVEIRRILASADLMTVTKKQVRDELTALFRVDMSSRKATINGFIEEILQGKL
ncbi:chitin synthase-domain-containing protein [Obelidium mucronatum]|nr:chitin synthase-domain-containing protein [Obelidium mucronatum]